MSDNRVILKSNYENFITDVPIYSALFKKKNIPNITKSSGNKARYHVPKQTKGKESKGE